MLFKQLKVCITNTTLNEQAETTPQSNGIDALFMILFLFVFIFHSLL